MHRFATPDHLTPMPVRIETEPAKMYESVPVSKFQTPKPPDRFTPDSRSSNRLVMMSRGNVDKLTEPEDEQTTKMRAPTPSTLWDSMQLQFPSFHAEPVRIFSRQGTRRAQSVTPTDVHGVHERGSSPISQHATAHSLENSRLLLWKLGSFMEIGQDRLEKVRRERAELQRIIDNLKERETVLDDMKASILDPYNERLLAPMKLIKESFIEQQTINFSLQRSIQRYKRDIDQLNIAVAEATARISQLESEVV
jgi:hypothetical protein